MAAELRVLRSDESGPDAREVELLALSQAGDADAFARLYDRYRAHLTQVCARKLRDPALAEDVVQDTFIRAYTSLERFDPSRRLLPWLIAIATRRCIDLQRRGARVTLRDFAEDGLVPTEVDDATLDAVIASEDRDRLRQALAQLPERQRRALLLFALEGWNYVDIASAEGTSLPSIKSLIFRARESLREACQAGALGAVLLPLRRLRVRARTLASTPAELLATAGINQLSAGLVAIAMTFGGAAGVGTTGLALEELRAASVSNLTTAQRPANAAVRAHGADAWTAQDAASLADDVTDPNHRVKQPEDARITSIVFSPAFERDGTIYASGAPTCRSVCPPSVLFKSTDRGASWVRLSARELVADSLLLPPGYGTSDARIFAMGALGLQVSDDGGASFRAAVPTAKLLLGSAAMSPTFDRGDPRILIGAQALVQYDDTARAFLPAGNNALPGPLEPAFSPEYARDGVVFVGGSRVTERGKVGAVFRCAGALCDEVVLGGTTPRIRFASDYATSKRVYAFNSLGLFVSDGGSTFEAVRGLSGEGLEDVLEVAPGVVLSAARPVEDGEEAGVFVRSGASSWRQVRSTLFVRGAEHLSMREDVIIAGLSSGVACSTDHGVTWSRRCAL